MPAISQDSTSGTLQMQLVFILRAVQTLPAGYWQIPAQFATSSMNLFIIDSLFKPSIRDPKDVRVIGGNGEALDLKGFALLPVAFGSSYLARIRRRAKSPSQSANRRRRARASSLLTTVLHE